MIKAQSATSSISFSEKMKAYAEFTKLRLASLVVFSAGITFWYASDEINVFNLMVLLIGGFLLTGSSNGFNQVIEKDVDALMERTKNRPLPSGKMTVREGLILSGVFGVIGVSMLLWLNPLTGVLGAMALLLYVGVYTPMKRISPFAVFVGAFPGAIPPLLGYVAVTGEFGFVPGMLFAIQFIWQFPHFWAIAWKLDDDYRKAGYHLLPSPGGKDESSARQTFMYSVFLIPVSLSLNFFGYSGVISGVVIGLAGLWFAYKAFRLYKTCGDKEATALMFASFIYLPIVQIALVLDKTF